MEAAGPPERELKSDSFAGVLFTQEVQASASSSWAATSATAVTATPAATTVAATGGSGSGSESDDSNSSGSGRNSHSHWRSTDSVIGDGSDSSQHHRHHQQRRISGVSSISCVGCISSITHTRPIQSTRCPAHDDLKEKQQSSTHLRILERTSVFQLDLGMPDFAISMTWDELLLTAIGAESVV